MIKVRAPGKINLFLRIVGVRSDGYHELRTVFQSIGLHDTLTFRRRRGPFRIECDDPACPADRTNLVWRAAARVWSASRRRDAPRDVVVHIDKRIPVGAGLGGGSSDAAAALRALGALWRVDEARLLSIATSLGADVPYFFEGGTVLGLERGDLLFPLVDHRSMWVTLAIPSFSVSTKDAYGWFDRVGRVGGPTRVRPTYAPLTYVGRALVGPAAVGRSVPAAPIQNDLQPPVAAHHPQITRLVNTLKRDGAIAASMSGSGSAVYGLFERRDDAEQASRAVKVVGRGRVRALVTRTVNRPEYQRLAALAAHRINLPFAPRGKVHI